MIDWLISLFFPEKCINCGLWGSYVCKKCQVGIWEAELLRALDGLICLWDYEGLAQKIIKKAKYQGQYDLLKFLVLSSKFEINNQISKFLNNTNSIVPVPLFKKRLKERGFNQAEIIAKEISRVYKVPVANLLLRIRDTGHQVGRTRAERLNALKDAFVFDFGYQIPNTVLLVDDVWTTGTTMKECYKVLKKAGIKKVYGLVLAR